MPIRAAKPRKHNGRWIRDVYLTQAGDWSVTYGAELPPYAPFRRADFESLIQTGRLVPTFPGTAAESQSYQLAELQRG